MRHLQITPGKFSFRFSDAARKECIFNNFLIFYFGYMCQGLKIAAPETEQGIVTTLAMQRFFQTAYSIPR